MLRRLLLHHGDLLLQLPLLLRECGGLAGGLLLILRLLGHLFGQLLQRVGGLLLGGRVVFHQLLQFGVGLLFVGGLIGVVVRIVLLVSLGELFFLLLGALVELLLRLGRLAQHLDGFFLLLGGCGIGDRQLLGLPGDLGEFFLVLAALFGHGRLRLFRSFAGLGGGLLLLSCQLRGLLGGSRCGPSQRLFELGQHLVEFGQGFVAWFVALPAKLFGGRMKLLGGLAGFFGIERLVVLRPGRGVGEILGHAVEFAGGLQLLVGGPVEVTLLERFEGFSKSFGIERIDFGGGRFGTLGEFFGLIEQFLLLTCERAEFIGALAGFLFEAFGEVVLLLGEPFGLTGEFGQSGQLGLLGGFDEFGPLFEQLA